MGIERMQMKIMGTSIVHDRQAGLTIIELMISLTLGLFIILAVTGLFISSKSAYASIDDAARVQDTGRYAIEIIRRAVHQASYENWDRDDAPVVAGSIYSADILGLDARSLQSNTPDIQAALTKSINGSDVLAVRYFGAGAGSGGDGTVLNCGGFGVPAPTAENSVEGSRGWSIFYVAADKTGESELRCKYRGKNSWTSDAVARGVESFQVLYGVDTDADGLPNQYVTASALNSLDVNLLLIGNDAQAKEFDKNKKTHWKKIVAIKVALLLRGTQKSRTDALSSRFDLFGMEYSNVHGSNDVGTLIKEANLPIGARNRIRKIFQQTVMLRNSSSGNGV